MFLLIAPYAFESADGVYDNEFWPWRDRHLLELRNFDDLRKPGFYCILHVNFYADRSWRMQVVHRKADRGRAFPLSGRPRDCPTRTETACGSMSPCPLAPRRPIKPFPVALHKTPFCLNPEVVRTCSYNIGNRNEGTKDVRWPWHMRTTYWSGVQVIISWL